jgi:PPOX class probable F420-dependent enzyme
MEFLVVQEYLLDNDRGVLVARKRDGSPQITLVTAGVDAEGRVVISARGNTFKVKNLRRDPRVSMLIMGEQFNGSKYYQLDGRAEIIEQPEAVDMLLEVYRRRLGDDADPEESRRKIIDQERVLIRIEIGAVGPQRRG